MAKNKTTIIALLATMALVAAVVVPALALEGNMTMGLRIPDVDEGYGLEIRRGVAQFHNSLPEKCDVVLEINRSTLESILVGD